MNALFINLVRIILILIFFLFCASPLFALEIEWGAPVFGDLESDAPVLPPEAGESSKNAGLEGAGLEKGFRGVFWGLTKEQMEDDLHMEFVQCLELPAARLNCALKGANKSIRDVPLILLRYKFIQGIFYGVSLKYDPKYEKDMYALYNEVLGPPTDYREKFPVWRGRTYEAWATDTHFSFSSKKVFKKFHDAGGTF